MTLEATLRQVAKTRKLDPEQFVSQHVASKGLPSSPPEGFEWYFHAFREVGRSRTYHMNGPNSISYAELQSWNQLCSIGLEPWEVDILFALDNVWLDVVHARLNKTGSNDSAQ